MGNQLFIKMPMDMDMHVPMGWAEMGDFTTHMEFMHTFLMKTVLATIFDTKHAAEYTTYFVSMMALMMVFCSSAYVIVQTVHAAIDFDRGYYFLYGSWSDRASDLGRDEMIVAVLYILWSFSMVLLGWYGTWSAWNQLQLRLEEADEN